MTELGLATMSLAIGVFLGLVIYRITRPVCKRFGCDTRMVVDCEERRVYNLCNVCGEESQYDFQAALTGKSWVGFEQGENRCKLCFGWKRKAYRLCGGEYCLLNPEHSISRN